MAIGIRPLGARPSAKTPNADPESAPAAAKPSHSKPATRSAKTRQAPDDARAALAARLLGAEGALGSAPVSGKRIARDPVVGAVVAGELLAKVREPLTPAAAHKLCESFGVECVETLALPSCGTHRAGQLLRLSLPDGANLRATLDALAQSGRFEGVAFNRLYDLSFEHQGRDTHLALDSATLARGIRFAAARGARLGARELEGLAGDPIVSATLQAVQAAQGLSYSADWSEKRKTGALSLRVTTRPEDLRLKEVQVGGKTYSTIDFHGGSPVAQKGLPDLPLVKLLFQTQNDANTEVVVKKATYRELPYEAPWLPSKGNISRNQNPDEVPLNPGPGYRKDTFYPLQSEDFVRDGGHFLVRDVRGYQLEVAPIQVNPVKKTVRVLEELEVELVPRRGAVKNPAPTQREPVVLQSMLGLYRAMFPNFRWDHEIEDKQGDILVVCTERDKAAVAPLVEHKRKLGFEVKECVVPKGTDVTQLIKDEYARNGELLYVLNVGDFDDLKCGKHTSTSGPTDNKLGLVAGDDFFFDLCVGRLSANSAEDVKTQVDKIVSYEQGLAADEPWKKQALGIASSEGAGKGDDKEMDKEHMKVIHDFKLRPAGFTKVFEQFDPGASAKGVTEAINEGVKVVNYTGHGSPTSWGTSGFNVSAANKLANAEKLPIVFSVACNVGEYDKYTCLMEALVRKQGGGAVAAFGSTVSQSWVPPMKAQDYLNDGLTNGYDYAQQPGDGISTDHGHSMLGPIIFSALNLWLAESSTADDLKDANTWVLFGDPSMRVKPTA